MMTEAPDMNPAMTEWLRKLVSQPSLNTPTNVYRQPAKNATCQSQQQCQAGEICTSPQQYGTTARKPSASAASNTR